VSDELPESVKISASQRHPGFVYIMVFHETVTPETALQIAKEIERVANEAKDKTRHQLFIEQLEARAKDTGRALSDGAQRAKQRPINYCELPPERQWEIDKSLGILDWDGT
jgi:hypothetical protein